MSIEALRWALDIGEERALEPTQRHILLILGNRADEQGYLYPSIAWICQRTGLKRRTVQINCNEMEQAGLFKRSQRANAAGDRTSDNWQLAMTQPGLALATPPRIECAPPRTTCAPPAHQMRPGGAPDAPNTQEHTQDQKKDGGRGTPSPVSLAFKAYADGIKRKYAADYPPSATANGQLANVVGRVGRDNVLAVVDAFFASQNPYYGKVKHRLGALVTDCERIFLEMQAAAPGAKPPTHARVALLKADGSVLRELEQYPAGDMEAIAKRAAKEYAGVIARLEPQYLSVVQGAERRRYAPSELVPA